MWDTVHWYEHVPNDAVEELKLIIYTCASAYKLMVDYLIPQDIKNTLDPNRHKVSIKQYDYHTQVIITDTGESIW